MLDYNLDTDPDILNFRKNIIWDDTKFTPKIYKHPMFPLKSFSSFIEMQECCNKFGVPVSGEFRGLPYSYKAVDGTPIPLEEWRGKR